MPSTSRIFAAAMGILVTLASAAALLAADEDPLMGKKVTVITWDAHYKVGDKAVGQPELGDVLTVDKVKGDWLGFEGHTGFLKKADVVASDKAIKYLTDKINGDPSAGGFHNRGICRQKRGEYDKAIADFSEAIRRDPKNYSAYNSRAVTWQDKQDNDKAITDFDNAIRLKPKYSQAIYNRGNSWRNKGNYDKAIEDYSSCLQIDPKYELAYINRGIAYSQKHDDDKAIEDFTEAIRLNPKNADTYQNRGTSWFAKRDYENAIADYGDALRLDPKNAADYFDRGNTWSQKGEYAKAIDDFSEAIKLNPQYADAYLNRAIAEVNHDEFEKGIADYDELIRLNPNSSAAFNNRGWPLINLATLAEPSRTTTNPFDSTRTTRMRFQIVPCCWRRARMRRFATARRQWPTPRSCARCRIGSRILRSRRWRLCSPKRASSRTQSSVCKRRSI